MAYGISLSGHTNIEGPHFHHIEAFARAVQVNKNLQGAVFYHHQDWQKVSKKKPAIQKPDFLLVDYSSYEGLYQRMTDMFNHETVLEIPVVLIDEDIYKKSFDGITQFAHQSPIHVVGVTPIDTVYNGNLTAVINALAEHSEEENNIKPEEFQLVMQNVSSKKPDSDSFLHFDESALKRRNSARSLPPAHKIFAHS